MRNVTKDNITDLFKGYMVDEMEPRMREIMGSLVQHLRDFVRNVNLPHDGRHEFVLASDVLGLSSLVDMLYSRPDATSSSVLGPFHVSGGLWW